MGDASDDDDDDIVIYICMVWKRMDDDYDIHAR